jgi:hypothetical protein
MQWEGSGKTRYRTQPLCATHVAATACGCRLALALMTSKNWIWKALMPGETAERDRAQKSRGAAMRAPAHDQSSIGAAGQVNDSAIVPAQKTPE